MELDPLQLFGCFLGGAFFTNAIPHYVAGLQGKPLQTPFAKPPGKGLSSAKQNVLWGWANYCFAYFILRLSNFNLNHATDFYAAVAGSMVIAFLCAHRFGPINGGDLKETKTPS